MIHFGQIWSKRNQKHKRHFYPFYSNIFRLVRNPLWSSLIHFGQIWFKKLKNKRAIFILSVNVTNFYRNIFRLVRKSNLIKFDQVWSSLDRSDLKKLKNKTVIFILSVNETTFYSNIFRLVRKSSLIRFDQVWSILDGSDRKKSKIKRPFLFFLKIRQLCLLTFFDMCNR